MPKRRSIPAADSTVQTTLQEERWGVSAEKFGPVVEKIRNLSERMYRGLPNLNALNHKMDDPKSLELLVGLWLELNNHANEVDDVKASLRDHIVLLVQSSGRFDDRKANGFLYGNFKIPVNGGEARIEHFDATRVPKERWAEFYAYARKHGLNLEEYTVPSLYLPFLAAKRGNNEAANIVQDLIATGIAKLARENRIKFQPEQKTIKEIARI